MLGLRQLRSGLLGAVCSLLFVACGSETTVSETQIKKDVWGNDEAYSIGKDADGNPVMKSDKRSSFENKSSQFGGNKDFQGKDYTASSYRKKRWGGNRDYGRKAYQGNRSADHYKNEPWFVRKQASASGKSAQGFNQSYAVNPYRTSSSSAGGRKQIQPKGNADIANRRKSYKQPEITPWKDQKGLTVGDTNSMLKR